MRINHVPVPGSAQRVAASPRARLAVVNQRSRGTRRTRALMPRVERPVLPRLASVFPGDGSLPAAGRAGLPPSEGSGSRRARERDPGGPARLAGRCSPGDLDVADAYLTGEPGGPPDQGPGCFHGRHSIARLALDPDSGLIQLVPACHRPDHRMPAGKRYRVLERPPPLAGQRRIQRHDHAESELVRAQLSRRTQPGRPVTRRPDPGTGPSHRAAAIPRWRQEKAGGCRADSPPGSADPAAIRRARYHRHLTGSRGRTQDEGGDGHGHLDGNQLATSSTVMIFPRVGESSLPSQPSFGSIASILVRASPRASALPSPQRAAYCRSRSASRL